MLKTVSGGILYNNAIRTAIKRYVFVFFVFFKVEQTEPYYSSRKIKVLESTYKKVIFT